MALGLVILFGTSCTLFQKLSDYAATETGALIIQESGEIAGVIVGFEDPDKIEDMIEYCDDVLSIKDESVKQRALEAAYKYFFAKYGHNPQTTILMSKVTKLVGLIVKDDQIEFLEGYDSVGVDLFVQAFRDGLALAVPKYVPRYIK